jgi:hypothetical protein
VFKVVDLRPAAHKTKLALDSTDIVVTSHAVLFVDEASRLIYADVSPQLVERSGVTDAARLLCMDQLEHAFVWRHHESDHRVFLDRAIACRVSSVDAATELLRSLVQAGASAGSAEPFRLGTAESADVAAELARLGAVQYHVPSRTARLTESGTAMLHFGVPLGPPQCLVGSAREVALPLCDQSAATLLHQLQGAGWEICVGPRTDSAAPINLLVTEFEKVIHMQTTHKNSAVGT